MLSPLKQDIAAGDLIMRVAGDGVGHGALAGAIRSHQGVHLALFDGQTHAFEDFGVFDADMQVFDFENSGHD